MSFIARNARIQNVHNIVIVEEGAEVQIINGCTTAPKVKEGLHIGISEFYLEKGSKLTFTMIHNWAEDFYVRPRGVTIVEDDAVFISNYVLLKPVKSIQSFPIAILKGKNSVASFNSILYGLKDSEIDIGSHIILEGENSSGQAISRAIVKDRAKIYSRGVLEAKHNQSLRTWTVVEFCSLKKVLCMLCQSYCQTVHHRATFHMRLQLVLLPKKR